MPPFEKHGSDLLTHKEQPKNTAELQAVLMEEFYLFQHPELTIDQLEAERTNPATKRETEKEIFLAWNNSIMRDKFRIMVSDPNYKHRLDITLNEAMAYSTDDE